MCIRDSTLSALPGKGEHIALYTSLAVREDALELFGFATFEERQTFEVLVSISKVGARTALSILSIYRPDDLRRIVFEEDVMALTRVSGIGKKTAQHVFLELKYKLKVDEAPQTAAVSYTHLDVYKRQGLRRAATGCAACRPPCGRRLCAPCR